MYEGLKNLEVPRRARRGSGAGAPPPHRDSGARKVVRTIVGLVVAVAVAGAALGTYTYIRVRNNLKEGGITLEDLTGGAPDGPLNILILGSDSRKGLSKEDKKELKAGGPAGRRADTIILLHISANENQKAVLVHFPRDLRVGIPGHGTNKINAAYAFGGAPLMIKTIKEFSGLDINHYVEVNFLGFREIVDAVGGVKIYVNRKLKDKKSGLDIPKAGCYTMDGKTALAFVRARNIDPTADLGRIQRQQLFMRALLRRVKNVGFLLDIGRVIDLSEAVSKSLRYDKAAGDIGLARGIAAKVAGFDQSRVDFRLVPSDPKYIGGTSYVIHRESESEKFFRAIANDTKLPPYGKTAQSIPRKKDVTVTVLNGTTRTGFAGVQGQRLKKLKFDVREIGNARREYQQTTIVYQAGAELKADLVAKYFKGARKQIATGFQAADIVVNLGLDLIVPSGSPTPKAKPAKKSAAEACV